MVSLHYVTLKIVVYTPWIEKTPGLIVEERKEKGVTRTSKTWWLETEP